MKHLDLVALRKQLAEYDPASPRCPKRITERRQDLTSNGDAVTVEGTIPCCRPVGHEGECRNSRRVMGWPGRSTLLALLDEVERLRS
jgi:hypothetical protein